MLAVLRLVQPSTSWGVFGPPARRALPQWNAMIVLPVSGATRCRIYRTQPPDFRAAPSDYNNQHITNTFINYHLSSEELSNLLSFRKWIIVNKYSNKSNSKYENHAQLNWRLKVKCQGKKSNTSTIPSRWNVIFLRHRKQILYLFTIIFLWKWHKNCDTLDERINLQPIEQLSCSRLHLARQTKSRLVGFAQLYTMNKTFEKFIVPRHFIGPEPNLSWRRIYVENFH